MSGSEPDAASRVATFAERYGINRRRVAVAAGLVGGVVFTALVVMNQRIQARRISPDEGADSVAFASSVEAAEPAAHRAAWADPEAARRMAGDTLLRADTLQREEYVPLGREIGPGGYGETVPREPDASHAEATSPGSFPPASEFPADQRPLTPAEMRLEGFRRAVASRQLRARRAGRGGEADSTSAATVPVLGLTQAERDSAGGLPPYGPAQVEEDRRAGQRAGEQLVQPGAGAFAVPVGDVAYVLAAFTNRPCRSGERVLAPGYVITATLASGVNSEVPGPVLARITRDVYDSALRCVIFPAGSVLVGRYPEGLDAGDRRLVVVWEQVVIGDGRTWSLPALPTADRGGAAGVPGHVDRRARETLEAAALLSAFGAALEYATPGGGQTPAVAPGGVPLASSPRDRAVGAATEPMRGAAERLLDRAVGIRPVLRLDAGYPVTVIVSRPVDLDRPAAAPPDSSRSASPPPAAS